jgi:hypothetical protein
VELVFPVIHFKPVTSHPVFRGPALADDDERLPPLLRRGRFQRSLPWVALGLDEPLRWKHPPDAAVANAGYGAGIIRQLHAFRAPGAPSIEQLAEKQFKVFHFSDIYLRMRRGVIAHDCYIDASNVDQLQGMDFVFLCLDRGEEKRPIVERLQGWGTRFVDVGMGVELQDGALGGVLRVTAVTPAKGDHVPARIPFGEDAGGDDYARNIQIADLNALNAALAVIRWKKHFGFYRNLDREHHSTYTIDGNMLLNEDKA